MSVYLEKTHTKRCFNCKAWRPGNDEVLGFCNYWKKATSGGNLCPKWLP